MAHRRPRPRGYLQRVQEERATRVQLYSTIVIDPPWPYEDRINAKNRGAANHYDLMSIDELKALPLSLVSAANSHLYLWTTNSFIEEACVLMRSWGWTRKTVITWRKTQIGMGRYFRNNTEHCLFGVRGRLPTKLRNVPTCFDAPRSHHSAKPEEFYGIAEKQSVGPYLDVFARQERAGWTCLGNALDGERIDVALRRLAA